MSLTLPPLSLYVHIPWCVQKCPYCDFNSHGLKQDIPEQEYVAHLLDDLDNDLKYVQGRQLHSIFIGGGTPSLFSEQAISDLLAGIKKRIKFSDTIEITLEANPGTLEYNKFSGFAAAGVNRISCGVQSFDKDKLAKLGRIHCGEEAVNAAKYAQQSVPTFNLDLMHGLPNQTVEQALSDLKQAIELNPPHISWYQLTIEENTLFHSRPPKLPQDDVLWDIQQQGQALLAHHGYKQYEVSAYSKEGHQSKHNRNYWRFGDYLGIGCGAHGKITLLDKQKILRTEKVKHPKGYMDLSKPYLYKQHLVDNEDLPFEYFMNVLRLHEPFDLTQFNKLTALDIKSVKPAIEQAVKLGYLVPLNNSNEHYQTTEKGRLFYNDLVDLFL